MVWGVMGFSSFSDEDTGVRFPFPCGHVNGDASADQGDL
jgi:hypothetical protein